MLNYPITGKIRRSTVYTVEFPTLPRLKIRPTTATLQQKQYFHDILTLEYSGITNANVEAINTGLPVKFTWKQGSRQKVWYGYVTYVSRTSASQKKRPIVIRCIGASFVLKKRVVKTYKNKTIPEVAALIAKEHKLKFVGKNHTRRFSQLSISGQSQWEWLHTNAARIGYAMYVSGTSLVFKPIDTLIDEFMSSAPLFQFWSDNFPRLEYQLDRTIDSFSVLKGEFLEDGSPKRTNKIVGGVDPVTSRPFSERTSPKETGKALRTQISDVLFNGFASEEVANSKLAARLASKGAAELARFNVPATLVGQGDPRVFPYRLITVDGITREFNGHWIIREVTHQFKFGGDYGVTMTVATDGVKENVRGSNNTTARTPQVNTFGVSPATTISSRPDVGTIDVSKFLNKSGTFNISASFTGGVDLSQLIETEVPYNTPRETTRLVSTAPYLTNINTQGFSRTPTLWTNIAPSSSSVSSANLGRKCS
jgi:phage protein D